MSILIQCKEWIRGAWRDPAQFLQDRKRRHCPCCGYSGLFVSASRKRHREYRCPGCESRPRDRQIALIFSRTGVDLGDQKILHFAPEWWLFRQLKKQRDYIGGDIIWRRNANAKVDITNIDYPDEHFDILICNHVLEHVNDDVTAMHECFRVMKEDALAIFTVPIDRNQMATFVPPVSMPKKEAARICRGRDHKRLYGLDIVDRLGDAGLKAEAVWFTDEDMEKHRFLDEPVFLCAKNPDRLRSITGKLKHSREGCGD